MEIRQYIGPLIKWWKLILVACVLAAVSSFLVVARQPPQYQSTAVLVIGRAVYELNPTGTDIGLAQQLATYYANIASRDAVRGPTMQALNLEWLPEYTVATVPNSQILEITVTDTDPIRAQAVANELANQLINQSPSNPDLQEQKRQQFLREQISMIEANIEDTLDQIAIKEAELGSLNSARQISQTQAEISTLQQKLTTLQSNYTGMLNASTGQGMNSLTLFQPATLPQRPMRSEKPMIILMSIAIALMVSGGAAYLIEFLDDTFENSDEISRQLNLPVIGFIPEIQGAQEDKSSLLVRDAKSMEAEAFRALRMNIDFLQVHSPIKTLLVVSVGKTEGKSVVAANLALAMARGGKKVVLLDADLRRPSLHKYINIPNDTGLSNIMLHELDVTDVMINVESENLWVISTGLTPPNPGEMVSSPKMKEILDKLGAIADLVVVDGPPVLVTDATILASKVDAVLLVVGTGRTRRSDAQTALKQLERAGARVIGAVLNRVDIAQRGYYKLYQYDYGVETSSETNPIVRRSALAIPFTRNLRGLTPSKRGSELDRPGPVVDET